MHYLNNTYTKGGHMGDHDQETSEQDRGAGKGVDDRGRPEAELTPYERRILALLFKAAEQPGYVDWARLSSATLSRIP